MKLGDLLNPEQYVLEILEGIESVEGNLPEDGNDVEEALNMAKRAIKKQMALKNVIGQIQELANEFQEGFYHEVHCKNREDNCEWKDCCACALERAIEIIKQEMM